MAEYKDVQQIKKRVREDCGGCWNRNSPSKCPDDCGVIEAIRAIDSVPPVDAVPVRRGQWIPCRPLGDHAPEGYMCSVCHVGGWEKTNYCPHCGAKMDGDDNG